jgi:hypothetical protein
MIKPLCRNWRRADGEAGKVAARGRVPGANSCRQRGHFPGASQMISGWDGHTHPLMTACFCANLNIVPLLALEYSGYSRTLLRRRALVITDTEEKLMAAAAMMGLSRMPNHG